MNNSQKGLNASSDDSFISNKKSSLASDDTKSMIGDEYLLVRKSRIDKVSTTIVDVPVIPKKDVTDTLSIPKLIRSGDTPLKSSVSSLLHNRKGGRGAHGRLPILHTKLAWSGSNSTAAAAANNTVINVDPTLSAEFTSFAALYDEIKVTGGQVHFYVVSAGGTPQWADGAIAYDPLDSSTYASVAGILVASQKLGPFRALALTTLGTVLNDPEPVNEHGMWKFTFHCPEEPSKVASNTAVDSEVATGLWASTNQSLNPKYGYIKPYVQGAGASVVITIYYYMVIDCSFRSRT